MQIKTFKPESHKIKALIFGASGTGKTTFAGTAKNAIFASAENGLLSIADKGVDFVEIKTIKDLEDLQQYLKFQKHNYETVVIDSITEINEIIKDGITNNGARKMLLQDWGVLASKIKKVFKEFRNLDMNVIFLAQEKIDKDEEKVIKINPSLNGKAATEICYFMDIVGYMKIMKDGSRVIITEPTATLPTKDRSNAIGSDTEVDFSVWCNNVSKIKIGKQESREVSEIPEFEGIPEISHKPEPKKVITPPPVKKDDDFKISMGIAVKIKEAKTEEDLTKISEEIDKQMKNITRKEVDRLMDLWGERSNELKPKEASEDKLLPNQLKRIQIIKKEKGLKDEEYRDYLAGYNVESSKNLTTTQAESLIKILDKIKSAK